MSKVGSESNPLRVAIIGSGPAGFYTVSNFLKQTDLTVEMDMFERLPTPFGLVRAGVAPDHQKYKTVTRAYDKSAQHSSFRFFGNVEYGTDITLEDLKDHYHQIMFATGAPSDRNLGIPGEELTGSHSATDFVAWYNGHPDCTDFKFDLSQESVAVIGLGNVAIDVARILCKTDAELASTDMADYALDALRESKVKNVYVLGRRGPAQAAFTPPEIKEMGELEDADVFVPVDEATLDPASQAELDASGDKNVKKNVAVIEEFSQRTEQDNSRHLTIRFLVSPTELIGENGAVSAIKIVKNEAYADENGGVKARATDQEEIIPVGMVFRSVGYRGAPVAEVPFDDYNGTIQNTEGRITDDDKNPLTGMYVAGWIKRGPTGVIGTNKTDAQETVNHMAEDARAGAVFEPTKSAKDLASLLSARKPDVITYSDWNKIDEHELSNGAASDRPRVKLTNIEDMLAVLN
ncbi:FAD-dependent oxidoreductase [Pseudomonadales bacterium]|nr:FAD-dependent oxidoreductase [Pseudomonadales bacterium]